MTNLWEAADNNIWLGSFSGGLSRYTQTNTQVTLTDEGYHIYRPPNKNPTDDGNSMWGGFIWQDPNGLGGTSSVLTEGHTYVVYIDMHGRTNNKFNGKFGWSHQTGWESGITVPSLTKYLTIQNNFNGYITIYALFTATNIIRVCPKTYSDMTQGQNYNAYYQFAMTFNYENTGDWGTDLYITGIRLYDLADVPDGNLNISKSGIVTYKNMIEVPHNQHTVRKQYLQSDNFIEL